MDQIQTQQKVEDHRFTDWANFGQNKKQVLAHQLAKVYDILGYGGAMGGGKSHWLRREVLYWVMRFYQDYGKKVVGAIFCEDYPSLQDRQIVKIVEEFPSWLGQYKSGDKVYGHAFILNDEYGGGVIVLRNLADVEKYDSAEFAVIGIDQAEKDSLKDFQVLRRRNRWPGISNCKFFCTANPGGEAWFEQYFVDRDFPPEEQEAEKIYFVQALPQDNPFLDDSYWDKLRSMPQAEQKAFMQGDWKAFASERDTDGYMRLLSNLEVRNAITEKVMQVGMVVLGVDVGEGGDKSTIVKKTDTARKVLFNKQLRDEMVFAGVVGKAIEITKPSYVVIDKIGVGAGVYYRLLEMKKINGWATEIIGVAWGGASGNKKLYVNLKSELFWSLRTSVLGGAKLLRHDAWAQLYNIKYKKLQGEDGSIYIQSKKEMREKKIPSPDVADAAALAEFPTIKKYKSKSNKNQGEFYDDVSELW